MAEPAITSLADYLARRAEARQLEARLYHLSSPDSQRLRALQMACFDYLLTQAQETQEIILARERPHA